MLAYLCCCQAQHCCHAILIAALQLSAQNSSCCTYGCVTQQHMHIAACLLHKVFKLCPQIVQQRLRVQLHECFA